MIFKVGANKKDYRCRRSPIIFKIFIYFAIPSLQSPINWLIPQNTKQWPGSEAKAKYINWRQMMSFAFLDSFPVSGTLLKVKRQFLETHYYDVRSGTKSILRFGRLGNTSSLRKLFFESLSVVFVGSVPCLRVVASLVSSYYFLRGTAGFSPWCRYGLMSSLRHFYVFVSSGLPFVDCATYLGRYLMYGDITYIVPTLLA